MYGQTLWELRRCSGPSCKDSATSSLDTSLDSSPSPPWGRRTETYSAIRSLRSLLSPPFPQGHGPGRGIGHPSQESPKPGSEGPPAPLPQTRGLSFVWEQRSIAAICNLGSPTLAFLLICPLSGLWSLVYTFLCISVFFHLFLMPALAASVPSTPFSLTTLHKVFACLWPLSPLIVP